MNEITQKEEDFNNCALHSIFRCQLFSVGERVISPVMFFHVSQIHLESKRDPVNVLVLTYNRGFNNGTQVLI